MGALIRSGFAGMIPDIVDLPFDVITGNTVFSPSNDAMLLSIPVLDLIRDVQNATQTTFKMATGQDTLGAEKYQYRKLVPLVNLYYFEALSKFLLPEDTPVLSHLVL